MFHFFVTKEQVAGSRITLAGSDVNHVKNVLRMKPGERVTISDGENATYLAELSGFDNDTAVFEILSKENFTSELPMEITLFQGLPKGDKMEWITEKAVELGVSEIVPVSMHRSIVKLDAKKEEARIRRYQEIAKTAAKQAGRNRIPEVKPVMTVEDVARAAGSLDALLVPYECAENMEHTRSVIAGLPKTGRIGIVIGPEGGFEQEEIERLEAAGGVVLTLGKRILRTETAGLFLLSVLSYTFGE